MLHSCIGVRESEKSRGNPLRLTHRKALTQGQTSNRPVYEEEDWQVPHLQGDCGELEQHRFQYWGRSDPCERSNRPFPRHSVTLLAHQSKMVIQQSTAKSHNYFPGYPYCLNIYGIEVTIIKIISHEDWAILGIYRSPKMPVRKLCRAITEVLNSISPEDIIVLGDFNVNWLIDTEKRPLYNIQLISTYATDSKTVIDHIYTNIHVGNLNIQAVVLGTYFTDHKAVWASLHATKKNKYM